MQAEYWLLSREVEGTTGPEKNIMSTCRELGVALVAATPLGRGILTSTHVEGRPLGGENDQRSKMMPRFLGDNPKHNADIVKRLAAFAERKGCSLTQLALAWLLKQKDVFVIPGTRRVKYVEENWEAATSVSLTDEEEAELRAFAESVKIAGDAIPEGAASWYYTDSAELTD
jgi:aryl-alcohol dehydrogenase-like predicted oxidoreductase